MVAFKFAAPINIDDDNSVNENESLTISGNLDTGSRVCPINIDDENSLNENQNSTISGNLDSSSTG